MASPPFGLSIHHFVSSVGADAGFAALVAVAILVLLYFAQARETATLRQRADEAGLRVEDLEDQLADLADQVAALPAEISVRAASPRAAAAYGGAHASGAAIPAGAMAGMASMTVAHNGGLPPAAPAGMAAPALAAATRLIPDPEPVRQPVPAPASLYGAPAPDLTTIDGPVPATAAGATNGSAQRPAAATIPRPVSAAVGAPPGRGPGYGRPGPGGGAGAGSGRPGAGGPGRGPAYARTGPGATGPRSARPGGPGPRSGRPPGAPLRPPPRRSVGRLVLGGLVAVLGLAAVAAAIVVLSSGGKSSSASRSSAAADALASRRSQTASAVVPATVTVSVLNGTDMTGLAGRVSQRLVAAGYRPGAVTDASDQTHTTSVVAYLSPAYRRDALAVASSLKLGPATVQPVDSGTEKIACTASAKACNSPVYVTVGTDLSH